MTERYPGRGAVAVTGGASGIGAAVCRRLAADGITVAVLDRDGDGAAAIAEEVGGHGLQVDVSDSDALTRALEQVAGSAGGLRGMVNNAGVGSLKPLEAYTDREFELIWRVNVAGVFNGLRASAPLLRDSGGGSIVNIASVSGVRPTRGEAPYSAAKAAVIALSMSAALELAPDVRVNCISPGFVHTPLNDVLARDERMRTTIEAGTPLGRLGQPEDVAELVALLLSERTSYLTGENIVLDGGSTLTSAQMDPVLGPLLGGHDT